MGRSSRNSILLVSLTLVVVGLACGLESPPATTRAGPRAATATIELAPTVQADEDTPEPEGTPGDVDAMVAMVTQALQSQDAMALSPLLFDSVLVAQGPNGDTGEDLQHEKALQWLNAHWGSRHTVQSVQYVEHFVLLKITTEGWAKVAPIEQGEIVFHLHRYTAKGESDPIAGEWRIDSILYR